MDSEEIGVVRAFIAAINEGDVDKLNERLIMAKIAEASADSDILHDKMFCMREAITIKDRQIKELATQLRKLDRFNKQVKDETDRHFRQQKNLELVIKVLVLVIIALVVVLTFIIAS